ncbi:MAG: ABC transporter permease [Actinobacteria bacterium]|nr:ABC transporter permease [Actinomycetota bacterium]
MAVPAVLRSVGATPGGRIGAIMIVAVALVALVGPLVAPHPIDTPVGVPGSPPGPGIPLGTDALGRDVLSRFLDGGVSVIAISVCATLLAYLAGVSIGMLAGLRRTWIDPLLMRGIDVLLAFPALLLMLVLVGGLGSAIPVLLLGVVLVQVPGIARVVRTATQELSVLPFVESARLRGERPLVICVREILPNLVSVIFADIGVRFGYAVVLVASMNFLNLGLQPPAADWGLMISENRSILALNPWAVAAPAVPLALLVVGMNLVGDTVAAAAGRSAARGLDPAPDAALIPPHHRQEQP